MKDSQTLAENPSVAGRNDAPPLNALQRRAMGAKVPASSPSPKEVIDQLHERKGIRGKAGNEREADRFPWVTKLKLQLIDPTGTAREREVTTSDLSVGGFSFLLNQYVHAGTLVITCIKALPEQPSLLCVVRNCVHVKGATHRVGVKFERAVPKRGAAGGAASGPESDTSNEETPAT